MMGAALICMAAWMAADEGGLPPEQAAIYRAAADRAGNDPAAHINLALWCEAHGLTAERARHLGLAVLSDPSNALARGLLGLVQDEGKWRRPEDVAARIQADADRAAVLAEYNAKRAMTPRTAEAQWKLALWCESRGLKAETIAHLVAVVQLDPKREEAWKRLGYKKHDGVWRTDEQIAAAKAEAEAQRKADAFWRPKLEKWKDQLERSSTREKAEAELAAITDPRAVPSIVRVFVRTQPVRAVQLLGQIDSPAAARALAAIAVSSPDETARRVATETLRKTDPNDTVGRLIGLVRKPIRYEVKPVGGPGSPGVLFVEGERFNQQFVYAPPPPPDIGPMPGYTLDYDEYGLPVLVGPGRSFSARVGLGEVLQRRRADQQTLQANLGRRSGQLAPNLSPAAAAQLRTTLGSWTDSFTETLQQASNQGFRFADIGWSTAIRIPIGQMAVEAQKAAVSAQQQLQAQVAVIESVNAEIQQANDRVLPVLQELTGQELGPDPEAWRSWWADAQGMSYQRAEYDNRPTLVQNVPLAYVPQPVPAVEVTGPMVAFRFSHSCFAQGTPVHTRQGPRPIESLQPGDQVLTQDPRTGELAYEPILQVRHNRPSPTLRLRLDDGQEVVCTPIHRLWKAGRGWVMARDLHTGDALRTLGGTARVEAVEEQPVQPVFNLRVRRGGSYFVGPQGVLAHDDRPTEPVEKPFDAPPELAAISAEEDAQ
jgi:hypothetical protein